MLVHHRGIAYQRDMNDGRVAYDRAYFDKCRGYEGQAIAEKINAGRIALVKRFFGDGPVLDVGVGSGEFIRRRADTFGFDINPAAKEWLVAERRWKQEFDAFEAFTFWDVLEHVEEPESYFRKIMPGSYLFACLPIFANLTRIRDSKHYRPGEHLYYFTEKGFVDWMALHGFTHLATEGYESEAGRENIRSFAFRHNGPFYHEMVAAYREMHATRYYGASASIYRDILLPIVQSVRPISILDFGCGRSEIAALFWKDGERETFRYDPAIPEFATIPDRSFDLVFCLDVMEHLLMRDVDDVLNQIRKRSRNAVFTISLKPARAKLPNGENAHVTLLRDGEWLRWIKDVFGHAVRVRTPWDHELMVKTFR